MLNKRIFKRLLKETIETKTMLALKCENWYYMDMYVTYKWKNPIWWDIYEYNIRWKNLDTTWKFICDYESDVKELYDLIYNIYKINNR